MIGSREIIPAEITRLGYVASSSVIVEDGNGGYLGKCLVERIGKRLTAFEDESHDDFDVIRVSDETGIGWLLWAKERHGAQTLTQIARQIPGRWTPGTPGLTTVTRLSVTREKCCPMT
jgi:hypothetical protein